MTRFPCFRMVVRAGSFKFDISAILRDTASFTLNSIEAPISVLNYHVIATVITKRCQDCITNFQELCYKNSLTPLSYRFIVLLWSK